MIGVKSYAEKAIANVARNEAAVARSQRRLEEHMASRPAGEDGERLYAWKRELRDLEDRLESDREALAFVTERAEQARVEAAERAADAEHNAEVKRAAADTKLVLEADALAAKLATKLAEIEASRARTDRANAQRGARAPISDAEFLARQRPGALIPAIVQYDTVWVNKDGAVVKGVILSDEGNWVRNPAAVRQEDRPFEMRQKMQLPNEMPERFADAFQLVNLAGEQIWPPR